MFRDPIFSSGQAVGVSPAWLELGYKFGDKGTHTSRTMMLAELSILLHHCPPSSMRGDYVHALVEENCLGKLTVSTRAATLQRLTELYGIDPGIPLFRLLRFFWDLDDKARPQLAVCLAIARDPLLRATAPFVLGMKAGDEMAKQQITNALRDAVQDRLNERTLDKVVRNTASSWTQSGHLEGRSRKRRLKIQPTPASTTFAMLLGYLLGNRARNLFETIFSRTLDRNPEELIFLAMDAKRLGLLDIKSGGGLMVISFNNILNEKEKRLSHGTY